MAGAVAYFLNTLFNRLEAYLFYHFSAVFHFHKNIGTEIPGIGLQGPDAEMSARRITLVLQVKSFYPVIAKKILHNKLGLCLAVTVAFVRKGQIDIVIKESGEFVGVP